MRENENNARTMKVAVMHGKQNVSIETHPIPEPKLGEVLIHVEAAGVCGSDLHYYAEGKIGEMEVQTPFILGHEIAGRVVCCGEGVTEFSGGELVAIEPGLPCGECEMCRTGHYNLCPDMRFLATPPYNGAFAEYMVYPAKWVYRLPENMTAVQGALIEPLAVGMHAAQLSGAELGDSALILGCGCIGLMALLALKSRGVAQIYMADILEKRMDKARELGASAVFDASDPQITEKILSLTHGRGVDSVFEMTGSASALMQTVRFVRKGGSIVLVGLGSQAVMPFDFEKLIWNEVQIRPCFRYKNIYPKAIRAISNGLIHLDSMVSDRVRLEDTPEALKYHLENKAMITKMIIEM